MELCSVPCPLVREEVKVRIFAAVTRMCIRKMELDDWEKVAAEAYDTIAAVYSYLDDASSPTEIAIRDEVQNYIDKRHPGPRP